MELESQNNFHLTTEEADLLNNPQYRPPHPEINNNTPSREERLMGANC
uniref:Uncharacterized protein n=1 Tax=Rhizophora mucronata TaxID=61149 RepID=A0A2P2M681_RHIMU